MSWTHGVECACGATDWVHRNGGWSCYDCDAQMTTPAVKAMHYREDCGKWLAAEAAHLAAKPGGQR